MNSGVKKIIVLVILLLITLPLLPKILPKPLTFERFQAGFVEAGLLVERFDTVPPTMEAVEQVNASIGGASLSIYRYDDEGKIVRNMEYQKKDPGAAMVEAWGLAQSLGAAVQEELPSRCVRRRMYMLLVSGPDEQLLDAIVAAFRGA